MIQKRAFTWMAIIFCSITVSAQKGNNGIAAGFEAGIPFGDFADFRKGPGIYGKALIGVGASGQVTLSAGYSSYNAKGSSREFKERTRIETVLAGYRFNTHGLYVEPQIGRGTYRLITKVQSGSTSTKTVDSKGSLTWALGGGLKVGRIDLGARYQHGAPAGSGVSLFGLHAGYQLPF